MPVRPPLSIVLFARPSATLATADLARFQLDFVVRNVGAATLDPHLERSTLFVDGAPAKDWAFTIGSGPRDARWNALPQGGALEFGYHLGDTLFRAPGAHVLVLEIDGVRSVPLTVTVR